MPVTWAYKQPNEGLAVSQATSLVSRWIDLVYRGMARVSLLSLRGQVELELIAYWQDGRRETMSAQKQAIAVAISVPILGTLKLPLEILQNKIGLLTPSARTELELLARCGLTLGLSLFSQGPPWLIQRCVLEVKVVDQLEIVRPSQISESLPRRGIAYGHRLGSGLVW